MRLSIIIPAHDPRIDHLERVIEGLSAQTLSRENWDWSVVDNASSPPIPARMVAAAHPPGRIVREPALGLTAARLAGFRQTTGEVLVLVDDDNVLAPDFLTQAARIAEEFPQLGTWSGRVHLEFEDPGRRPPERWWHYLAHRNIPAPRISRELDDHDSTPWGAGMCIRREVVDLYLAQLDQDEQRQGLDLSGDKLVYGGDTDIAYTGCRAGFDKGVFPELALTHLIPPNRCSVAYFQRAIEGHGYSDIMHQVMLHGTPPVRHRTLRRWAGDWWHALRQGRWAVMEHRAYRRGQRRAWQELASA